MKILFRDYINGWRLERIKSLFKFGKAEDRSAMGWSIWFVLYGGIQIITAMNENDTSELNKDIVFLLFAAPIVFNLLSISLHPTKLAKIYYLCPMDKEKRLDYIKKSYYFRTCIHFTIYMLSEIILFALFDFIIEACVYIMINNFLLSLIVKDNEGEKSIIYVCVLMICGWLTNLIQMNVVLCGKSYVVLQVILYVIMIIIQIPAAIKYEKNIMRQINDAVEYD